MNDFDDRPNEQDYAELGKEQEMEEIKSNPFVTLASINVNAHVEKKGNLSYLSWAWAVDQLLRRDPRANWEYAEPTVFKDGTVMVHCAVTAFGVTRRMQLPVMDHRNKAIAEPDAFAVNTAMQRALVKAIALHGLGLYIYAGEDLPVNEDSEPEAAPATTVEVALDTLGVAAMRGGVALDDTFRGLSPQTQAALKANHMPQLQGLRAVAIDADNFKAAA